jgi:hypothetical protein
MRQLPLVEQAMGRQSLALLRQLDAACQSADDLEAAAVESFSQHPDAGIITSFPGIGALTGARVLAEIGDDRSRFQDARGLKAYADAAPVTRAKSRSVAHRRVKNNRLAAAGYIWAFSAITASPGARAHYDRRRDAGDRHAAAQRNLFGRLLGCFHHCLTTGPGRRMSWSLAGAVREPAENRLPGVWGHEAEGVARVRVGAGDADDCPDAIGELRRLPLLSLIRQQCQQPSLTATAFPEPGATIGPDAQHWVLAGHEMSVTRAPGSLSIVFVLTSGVRRAWTMSGPRRWSHGNRVAGETGPNTAQVPALAHEKLASTPISAGRATLLQLPPPSLVTASCMTICDPAATWPNVQQVLSDGQLS